MTYNCVRLLEKTYMALPDGLYDDVIVVDDESTDGSAQLARRLGLRVFEHPHTGYGGNIKYGLQKAVELGADYMVEIHGDGQYDVNAAVPAVAKAREGYDLVMGSRFMSGCTPLKDKMPFVRYLANIGLSTMARVVTRAPLTEFHNGLRVYSRKLVETMDFSSSAQDWLFGFQVIVQAQHLSLRLAEVPVRCFYGNDHTSISLTKSARYAFQMTWVLAIYLAAKLGFQTKLFPKLGK